MLVNSRLLNIPWYVQQEMRTNKSVTLLRILLQIKKMIIFSKAIFQKSHSSQSNHYRVHDVFSQDCLFAPDSRTC